MVAPVLRFIQFKMNGWAADRLDSLLVKVSDPVKVELNKSYREIGIRSHGKGIFHKDTISGRELGTKRVFWVKPDALVLNIVFAWEQAVAVTTEAENGFIASHRFPMFLPKNNLCSTQFLKFLFLTKRGKTYLELASPGGAGRNKTLGQKNFDELKVFIPKIEEQIKISNFLKVVDEKITQLTQKYGLLTQYKKGVMQQIFSKELRFRDDDGSEFSEWEEVELSKLGKSFNGLTGKTGDDFGEGQPYITYKQIFDDSKIDVSKFSFVKIAENENQNQVKYGDIFFTTSSETPEEVGFCSVLLTDVENVYLNSFCFGFRINSFENLHPNFARYLFKSPDFRKDVVKLAQGSTRYNISKTNFMQIKIKLPQLNEQTKIANFLAAIDDKIRQTQVQLDGVNYYKQGLLQQMFV